MLLWLLLHLTDLGLNSGGGGGGGGGGGQASSQEPAVCIFLLCFRRPFPFSLRRRLLWPYYTSRRLLTQCSMQGCIKVFQYNVHLCMYIWMHDTTSLSQQLCGTPRCIKQGVRQGSILSPLLYYSYFEGPHHTKRWIASQDDLMKDPFPEVKYVYGVMVGKISQMTCM